MEKLHPVIGHYARLRSRWFAAMMWTSVLAACGGSLQYGSFLDDEQQALQEGLASDAVQKVVTMHPPETNSIQMLHDVDDPFGEALVNGLRAAGYLVLEDPDQEVVGYHAVAYVVDRLGGTDMLRIKLVFDEHSMSRAYVQRRDGLYPVGAWSSEGLEGAVSEDEAGSLAAGEEEEAP